MNTFNIISTLLKASRKLLKEFFLINQAKKDIIMDIIYFKLIGS